MLFNFIDLPNRDAWGKKKSTYYSTDFVDQDRGRSNFFAILLNYYYFLNLNFIDICFVFYIIIVLNL